jgi:hypothetical protein
MVREYDSIGKGGSRNQRRGEGEWAIRGRFCGKISIEVWRQPLTTLHGHLMRVRHGEIEGLREMTEYRRVS